MLFWMRCFLAEQDLRIFRHYYHARAMPRAVFESLQRLLSMVLVEIEGENYERCAMKSVTAQI
jgi:hypothetical protein